MNKKDGPLVRVLLQSMLEKLQEEVMGSKQKFKVDIQLLAPNEDQHLVPVSLSKVEKARELQSASIKSADGWSFVSIADTNAFFDDEDHSIFKNTKMLTVPPLSASTKHHVFISYSHQTAMDQVGTLYELLSKNGFNVWYDQMCDEITEPAMKEGVRSSHCLLIFLSRNVMTREFCVMEAREAVALGKKILLVHEEDRRNHGFADLYEIFNQAPQELLPSDQARKSQSDAQAT